jgi:hypothetical protein
MKATKSESLSPTTHIFFEDMVMILTSPSFVPLCLNLFSRWFLKPLFDSSISGFEAGTVLNKDETMTKGRKETGGSNSQRREVRPLTNDRNPEFHK